MAKAIAFLVLLIIAPAVYAATYNVGGSSDWTNGFDYDTWARSQNFVVGDTLVFTFDGSHAVAEVNQAGYNGCNTNGPIITSTSSPTNFTLGAVGPRYFLCPRSNHCDQGQKLVVNVRAAGTPTTPTPGIGTPSGGAASILGGSSLMVVGLSLLLGFMG